MYVGKLRVQVGSVRILLVDDLDNVKEQRLLVHRVLDVVNASQKLESETIRLN